MTWQVNSTFLKDKIERADQSRLVMVIKTLIGLITEVRAVVKKFLISWSIFCREVEILPLSLLLEKERVF